MPSSGQVHWMLLMRPCESHIPSRRPSSYIGEHIAGSQSRLSDVASVCASRSLTRGYSRRNPTASYKKRLATTACRAFFSGVKKLIRLRHFAMLPSIPLLLFLSYCIASAIAAIVPSSASLGRPAPSNTSDSLLTINLL